MNDVLIIDFNKFDIQCIKSDFNVKFYISNLKLYIYYFDIIVKKDRRIEIVYLNQIIYIIRFFNYFNY